jgi:diguanylate cyclase (GGDEF)-like protein
MSVMTDSPIGICPIPANEVQRLQATRACEILDTAPDPRFDAITRLAASLFQVPVALITILDQDRLWFKSRLGLDVPQLDRRLAFCSHAIMNPRELLIVEDLAADPRFAAHPMVAAAPHLRFYAGAPLVGAGDLAIGTFAVLDVRPRTLGARDRAALTDLSVAAMTAVEAHKRAGELVRLATSDHLTGAANRATLEQALRDRIGRGAPATEPFLVLRLNLDRFRQINDRHGHAAGDLVLCEVAERLRRIGRSGDLLARTAGDEFVLVLAPGTGAASAPAVAARTLDGVNGPFRLPSGAEIVIRVSAGVAAYPDDGQDPGTLLDRADHALYVAKAQINQRWASTSLARSTPGAEGGAGATIALAPAGTATQADADERCAACADGIAAPFPFSMAFQPIVDVDTRTVYAYEALVRGTGGEGAMSVLDKVTARNRYAFDQSCRITAIRLAAALGIAQTDAYLSINFIPGAMYEPRNCIRATLAAARRYAFRLDRLIFEVTEGEEVTDKEKLREIFDVYQQQGFQTAIDDFGAGFSGLNLLKDFQPHIIKLDMEMIRGIHLAPAQRAIVRAVVAMCREMRIEPIAEGVETLDEYRVLYDMGIRLFQGYLFARPAFEALPAIAWP